MLVEKGDINAGASGANHGLLHSGGRYVGGDPAVAKECRDEAQRLKRLAPHCIEKTGGFFVAVEGDDETYVADFPRACARATIPVREWDLKEALEAEPALSGRLMAAYEVEDATLDPFMLSLDNMAEALRLGAGFLRYTRVTGFRKNGGRIRAVHLCHTLTGETSQVEVAQVVNAAGSWAGEVAALAGIHIPLLFSKGTLVVTDSRLTHRVVNRLRPPGNGDILVPGGTVSILGTTSVRIDTLDQVYPTIEEVDLMVEEGAAMIPMLEGARYIRAYAGVRPLIRQESGGDDRSVSRGFALLDHTKEGFENFATIPGGKLTTYRLMAEKTADLVCDRLGVSAPCQTRTRPLPASLSGRWTEPGLGPRLWLKQETGDDPLLCECEMISKSMIDHVIDAIRTQKATPSLRAISLRSRMGKGPCQGTFCGRRVLAHLYEQGHFEGDEGLDLLRDFFQERWKGERPILWGGQLIQAELKEALYEGLLGLNAQGAPQEGKKGQDACG